MSEAGRILRSVMLGVCAVTVVWAGTALAGSAEDAKTKAGNVVGAGTNWQANVATGKNASIANLDEKQAAALKAIDGYFSAIGDLRGKFLQTDAEQQQQKGEFFIKRPGKFRFVYGAPSKLVILSDGETLSFEDYDLKKADRYPVESSPFRILLGKDVNIARDADIKDLNVGDDLITVTLQDKSADSQGQIQLFFVKAGDQIELKEWVITGPQGDNTRVEVANIERDKPVDPTYFQNAPLELQSKTK
jgi:outer membrane lipoprotein carrier protein